MSKSGVSLQLFKEILMNCIIWYHIEEGILNNRASSTGFASRLFPIYLLWHDVPSCEDIQSVCSTKIHFPRRIFLSSFQRTPYLPCKECPFRVGFAAKKLCHNFMYSYIAQQVEGKFYIALWSHIYVCIKWRKNEWAS